MRVAHKIALDPNTTQRSYFVRASGTARFAYNWALGAWKKQYQADRKPSEVCLRRQLNARKRGQYPWMFDVTKCAVQEAIIDLGAAFRAFFEKRGAYPRFRKRGVHDGFCAAHETGLDLNAAPNLERLAASSAVSACGEESSSVARNGRVKRTSMKREPNGEGERGLAQICVGFGER